MAEEKIAQKDKNNDKGHFLKEFLRTRKGRIALAGGVFFLALLLIAFIGVWLPLQMFPENPRFTLTRLELKTNPAGFWAGKEERIAGILQLNIGKDNLFKLDMSKLAKRLTDRSGIAAAGVRRVLPDTLQIEIRERIPRALLNGERSAFVVDEECTLMTKFECMDLRESLPVILGVSGLENFQMGAPIMKLEEVMAYLNLARTTWGNIRFEKIILRNDCLICAVRYKNTFGPYRVTLPRQNAKVKMQELVTALERVIQTRSTKRDIDLRYENRTILRDLPQRK